MFEEGSLLHSSSIMNYLRRARICFCFCLLAWDSKSLQSITIIFHINSDHIIKQLTLAHTRKDNEGNINPWMIMSKMGGRPQLIKIRTLQSIKCLQIDLMCGADMIMREMISGLIVFQLGDYPCFFLLLSDQLYILLKVQVMYSSHKLIRAVRDGCYCSNID